MWIFTTIQLFCVLGNVRDKMWMKKINTVGRFVFLLSQEQSRASVCCELCAGQAGVGLCATKN